MRETALSPRSDKKARLLTALFFLLLAAIGCLTSFDYGLNFDAMHEQYILKLNLREYGERLLGKNHPFKPPIFPEPGVNPLPEYFERFHGQSAYYLATPLLKLETHARDWMRPAWNMYTFLVFMAGIWAVYALCRGMGVSRILSAATSLILYLTPRFFAEGHYNTKDITVLSLILLTLWLGQRFLYKPGLLRGLLFSLLGAMATNTRIVGAFAWGLVGVAAVMLVTARKAWTPRLALTALATALSFVGFFILLTPASWPDIPGHLRHIIQNSLHYGAWEGKVLYQGHLYDPYTTPLPPGYIPHLILLTLPLYTLPLMLAGQTAAILEITHARTAFFRDERKLLLAVATLLWAAPLAYAALGQPVVYNSWRHFYFVYAGIILMAGSGISRIESLLNGHKTLRRLAGCALALCLALSAVGIALNHPYQYGYYNLLAPRPLENDYELDYWEVSTVNALGKLYSLRDSLLHPAILTGSDPITIGSLRDMMILPREVRSQIKMTEDGDAPYILYNTTYAAEYSAAYPPYGYHELFRIDSYGNTLCILYERD